MTKTYHPTFKTCRQNRQKLFLYFLPLSSVHYILHFSVTKRLSWRC